MRTRAFRTSALLIAIVFGLTLIQLDTSPAATRYQETLILDARNPLGATTSGVLQEGRPYVIEAAGLFDYFEVTSSAPEDTGKADVECTNFGKDQTFQRSRWAALDPGGDYADVYVGGQNVDWVAKIPDTLNCSSDHTYYVIFRPQSTGPLSFIVRELNAQGFTDNWGGVTIKITEAELSVGQFLLDTSAPLGVNSPFDLNADTRYRIEVAGAYSPKVGVPGLLADAECVREGSAPGQRNALGLVLTPDDPANDIGDVYVNGTQIDWVPRQPTLLGCDDTGHSYTHDFTAATTGALNLRVQDTYHADNSGALSVNVFELYQPELPAASAGGSGGGGGGAGGDSGGSGDSGGGSSGGWGSSSVSETVVVDTRNPNGATSVNTLIAGHPYMLRASGTFSYIDFRPTANQTGIADVECTNFGPDSTFQRNRWILLDPTGDFADIYVNGQNLEWQADDPDAFGCAQAHKYSTIFVPEATGPVTFVEHEINPQGFSDNSGAITIKIDDAMTFLETFPLSSAAPQGVNSTTSLIAGGSYRIEVKGVYKPNVNVPALSADAECTQFDSMPGQRNALTPVLLPGNTQDDIGDVYVNGRQVDWVASNEPVTFSCDDFTHIYTFDFTAQDNGSVNLRIFDTYHGDNSGQLEVTLFSLPNGKETATQELTLPATRLAEQLTVMAADPDGESTVAPLIAGRTYMIEAEGIYSYDRGLADAECATADGDTTFLADRFTNIVAGVDLLDLLIDTLSVEWVPTIPGPNGCNVVNHTYRYLVTPNTTHRANFRMASTWYPNNGGAITVRVFHVDEVLIGFVDVPATSPGGVSTPPLLGGRNYRLQASGIYSPWTGNEAYRADAECSANDTSGGYQPNLYASLGIATDLHDVYVSDTPVTWVPLNTDSEPCDPAHEYEVGVLMNVNGSINLKIVDTPGDYGDNSGSIRIQIFLRAD